ncbi:tetratricopeptide repeat protein [Schaalia vaccimaxillae]|uniref:tetratricopeptide repeat protein n=1 Tax=Schaalia vaccimaxillae TaxID=183916 RepID=UPI0004121B45|nr:tetratricopeptide repeat protein [Schaalia vaccimaxillae]
MNTNTPETMPADSHGAVDLSGRAEPPVDGDTATQTDHGGVGLEVPLIASATDETFQDVMAASQTVPVIVALWSGRSLESKPALAAFEESAREAAGAFQLVEIDIDQAPQIAQAFQVQAVPAFVALIGGRPVPLFQGAASKEQIRPVIDQLLEAAAQMGVTGRVAVTQEQTAPPTPAEHEAPLAAEEAGDLDLAISGWERVIELNPRDDAAKSHLARVRLLARSASADGDDPADRADALFASGDAQGAFDLLLGILESETDEDRRNSARLRLLDLFRVAGSTPEVKAARMRLATMLLV